MPLKRLGDKPGIGRGLRGGAGTPVISSPRDPGSAAWKPSLPAVKAADVGI
jgi:hypothetical protein